MALHKQTSVQRNWKIILGSIVIAAAVIYLIISSTQANAQYYLTVDELISRKAEFTGQTVRISGAVMEDSIQYDAEELKLVFTAVHIPADEKAIADGGGIAQVLHDASTNSSLPHLQVIYYGVKPDLLTAEAQAVITGKFSEDNQFYADELLLKCPSRYEEELPEQAES